MRTIHCVAVSVLLAGITTLSIRGGETPDFEAQVLPILRTRCVGCHGGASGQAGLDLSTREGILKGGRSGAAIQPGASDKSLLVEKIVSRAMPPTLPKLTDADIAVIRSWVDKGDNGKDVSGAVRSVTELLAFLLLVFQLSFEQALGFVGHPAWPVGQGE
jgi:hypothetical protein